MLAYGEVVRTGEWEWRMGIKGNFLKLAFQRGKLLNWV